MKKIDSIVKTLLLSMFFIIVTIVTTIGGLWIYKKYENYNSDLDRFAQEFTKGQKKFLKEEVERLIHDIEFQKKLIADKNEKYIFNKFLERVQSGRYGNERMRDFIIYEVIDDKTINKIVDVNNEYNLDFDLDSLLHTLNTKGEEYINIATQKSKNDLIKSKLTYFKYYKDYNLIIGLSIYYDLLEETIAERKFFHIDFIQTRVSQFIAILIFAMIVSVLISKYISDKIQKSFTVFNRFFIDAAKKFKKIDEKSLNFKEFKYLARSVNEMIDQHKKAQELLEFHQQYLQTVLDSQKNIMIVKSDSKLIGVNQAFYDFLGCKSLDDFKKDYECICDLFIDEEEYLGRFKDNKPWIEYILDNPEIIYKAKIKRNAVDYIFVVNAKKIKVGNNERTVIVFTNVSELEQQRKKFQIEATTDSLTNIANRLKFTTILEQQIEISNRYDQKVSLIIFDIDNFKSINDTYGHKVGDYVLIDMTKLIAQEIRKSDTFARWGGEEFTIIMPQTDLNTAYTLAEKFKEAIQNYFFQDVKRVTCSFGVTEYHKNESIENFVKRADTLLYQAKREGKNRVCRNDEI